MTVRLLGHTGPRIGWDGMKEGSAFEVSTHMVRVVMFTNPGAQLRAKSDGLQEK